MDPMGNALARSDLLRTPSHKDDQQLEKLAGKSGTANHQGLSVPTIKTKTLANAGQRCCLFWLVSIWDISHGKDNFRNWVRWKPYNENMLKEAFFITWEWPHIPPLELDLSKKNPFTGRSSHSLWSSYCSSSFLALPVRKWTEMALCKWQNSHDDVEPMGRCLL